MEKARKLHNLLNYRGEVGPLRKDIQGTAQRSLTKGRPSWRMKGRNSPALCKVLEHPTGSGLDAYLKRIRNFKDHSEIRSFNSVEPKRRSCWRFSQVL